MLNNTDSEYTIDQIVTQFGVCEATVRNWIKTGCLQKFGKNTVTRKSFEVFLAEIVGKEKLNSRANKQNKDTHNHVEISEILTKKIQDSDIDLGEFYENELSESFRNIEGIYYTPAEIVADMFSGFSENFADKTFCDPACGSGNFIISALELGFLPENVYGFDTDPNAVKITLKRIFDKTGYHSSNIKQTDFLDFAINSIQKFDYIFTNPPWGKKIEKAEKERYGNLFKAGKSSDTSALFVFAGLSVLAKSGVMGYLLPDAFFNISNFQDARKKISNLSLQNLTDYGKAFKGLQTGAQAFILRNEPYDKQRDSVTCTFNGHCYERSAASLRTMPKSILNFWTNPDEAKLIEHVFSLPHITLANRAEWGLGIVTGNNNKYRKSEPEPGYMPVYKGSDITKTGLKPASVYIPTDLSLYQQVAPRHLYEAHEKIIYKFISDNLGFYCDTEQRYLLNSANMLILKSDFPISAKQLCDLLNSNFMNTLFKSLFRTHKILRGDLELLPLHTDYFKNNPIFVETEFLEFIQVKFIEKGKYQISF